LGPGLISLCYGMDLELSSDHPACGIKDLSIDAPKIVILVIARPNDNRISHQIGSNRWIALIECSCRIYAEHPTHEVASGIEALAVDAEQRSI